MKKTLICLLALVLVLTCLFAMTACKEDEDPKKESEAEDTSSLAEISSVESTSSQESASSETDTSSEEAALEGYALYSKDGISFVYPEDWEIENDIIIDENGNNINMTYTAASKEAAEVYESLSNDTFMDLLGNIYEAMGMTINSYDVKTNPNENGVKIICCRFSLSLEGIEMNMCQFLVLGEKKHYTVTVTEMTDIDDVVDEVFDSIRID